MRVGMSSFLCYLFLAFMCGRTACTLDPVSIVKACSYRDRKGKKRRTSWKDAPGGQLYKSSYNMAPGSFTPVLISLEHFKETPTEPGLDFAVMPMKWGLVPRWHKDSPGNKISFKTSNCRGESMLEKATFKSPLLKGQRCVVLMDGFYEWKTTPSGKQPYYFQISPHVTPSHHKSINTTPCTNMDSFIKEEVGTKKEIIEVDKSVALRSCCTTKQSLKTKQEESSTDLDDKKKSNVLKMKDDGETDPSFSLGEVHNNKPSSSVDLKQESDEQEYDILCSIAAEYWDEDNTSEINHRLLTCAAVYDMWQPSATSKPLYSYSIITVSSSKDMSWCHHRMPAVLSTDQEVCDWLDFSTVPLAQAQKLITSKSDCLSSHPVSKRVNNSQYQSSDSNKPVDLLESEPDKKVLTGSGKMMMNWLKRPSSDAGGIVIGEGPSPCKKAPSTRMS